MYIYICIYIYTQDLKARSASPSNLGSSSKCISICVCRLAPVQDASAHAHSLRNAVGIRTSCQQHVFFVMGVSTTMYA